MTEEEEFEFRLRLEQETASEKPTGKGASGTWKGKGASGGWEQPSGFKQGFLNDPLTGLQQLATETETAALIAPDWVKRKRAEIQQQEQQYQAARGEQGIDWARLGGQMVNPVNLGIAAMTKTPPGASLLERGALGGLGGSMMGLMSPTYGDASREGQGAAGGVGGVVAAPLAGMASRVVKPNVSPDVALLRGEGIVPTVGQSLGGMAKIWEDKATSFPIMGDAIQHARKQGMNAFQRAGYNRALSPIGEKADDVVGFEGMEKVHRALGRAYDDILKKISFKPDQQFLTDTATLRQALPAPEQALYDRIVANVSRRATPQGNMSGETYKNVESTLGEEISKLAKDGSYEKGLVADALKQYRESMRQGLERVNPMFAPRLRDINEGWANYAILRRAASGPAAAKTGTFTPTQLMQGVQQSARRQGQAVGQGKLSEGKGLMQDLATAGESVLPSKYPDSGTAGRLMQNILLNPMVGIPQAAAGATVGAVGAIPYAPGIKRGLDLLMNARPELAGPIAEAIKLNPALLSTITPAMIQSLYNAE